MHSNNEADRQKICLSIFVLKHELAHAILVKDHIVLCLPIYSAVCGNIWDSGLVFLCEMRPESGA
jgi:hypothetical protein